jgi:hypothetical protein
VIDDPRPGSSARFVFRFFREVAGLVARDARNGQANADRQIGRRLRFSDIVIGLLELPFRLREDASSFQTLKQS